MSINLIRIDKVADYIPGVCAVTNIVALIAKGILNLVDTYHEPLENHTFQYFRDKDLSLCLILIFLPVLGNLLYFAVNALPDDMPPSGADYPLLQPRSYPDRLLEEQDDLATYRLQKTNERLRGEQDELILKAYCLQKTDKRQTIQLLEHAVRLYGPRTGEALFALATLYYEQGDLEKCLPYAERLEREYSRPEASFYIAEYLEFVSKKLEAAHERYLKLMETLPLKHPLRVKAGQGRNRLDEALFPGAAPVS